MLKKAAFSIVIAAILTSVSASAADSPSNLLEKGIYTEETVGDLDKAIEIYEKIIFDGLEHISVASFSGMAERTMILNGFSKAWAMTGWRLGYAIGPKDVIGAMGKLQSQRIYQF